MTFVPSSVTRRPGLLAVAMMLLLAGPGLTATLERGDEAPGEGPGRGAPMEQRFLEGGVSVVTTARGPSCVASARIDIAASGYRDEAGMPVPFDRIVRSPAASIQAVLGPASDAEPGFRVQMKFSPRKGLPMTLRVGDAEIDLAPRLEASTDSFWIDGEAAQTLAAAFRAGAAARIDTTSRDTGHRVTDAVPAPDLAALADCAGDLDPEARPGPLADQVGLSFEATPDAATLATPDKMRACGMAPTDRPLHVGRLMATTGFFAQVPTVFVAFDDAGRVERAYIPGILDADLGGEASGPVRVSRAADGNVPDAANAVTGCIGAYEVTQCLGEDGRGHHHLFPCADPSGVGAAPAAGPVVGPLAGLSGLPGGVAAALPGGAGRSGGGGGFLGGGSGSSAGSGADPVPVGVPIGGDPSFPLGGGDPLFPPGGGGDPPDPKPPGPSPVPLPAAGLLLLAALGGTMPLRRRA